MPRDSVTITSLVGSVAASNPAGTTIVPANGATIPKVGDTRRLLVRVTNTDASQRIVTFKAGVNPPAPRAGLGDLAVTVPASTGDVLVVLEAARHVKADGSIDVDFGASMAGKISAVRLPKGA